VRYTWRLDIGRFKARKKRSGKNIQSMTTLGEGSEDRGSKNKKKGERREKEATCFHRHSRKEAVWPNFPRTKKGKTESSSYRSEERVEKKNLPPKKEVVPTWRGSEQEN